MRKKLSKIFFAILVSVTILYFLLRNINTTVFFDKVKNVNVTFIGLIVIGFFFLYLSRTLRFSLVVKKDLSKIFFISTIHNFLNKLLPFRSGELSWPLLLKKYLNVSIADGLGLLLLVRYLDIFAIIALFTTSALFVQPEFLTPPLLFTLSSILIVQILSLVYLRYFVKLARMLLSSVNIGFLNARSEALILRLDNLEKKTSEAGYLRLLITLIPLSFINWLSIYFIYYAYILMFDLDFSFLHVIIACSIVNIFTNLPINGIGRFGTFELGWAAGFILLGMTKDVAIPLGLFVNVGNTLVSCILAVIGYIFLLNS